MKGANLARAKFDHATSLTDVSFQGASVKEVDYTDTNIKLDQLHEMFGDASVILPGGHGPEHEDWPEHWSKEKLDWDDFEPKWRAFQVSIGQDPKNPE